MKKSLSGLSADFLQNFWQHYITWSFIITAIYTVCYTMLIYTTHGEFFYIDPDSYTRALRIVDWLQDFQWQEKIFPYTNHPDGFILHFTRINDIIWLIFTSPFLLFFSLKDAVFYGGFLFSPFFLFLTLATALWGIKPYIEKIKNKELFFFIIFVFSILFCCKLTIAFDFQRPDHHSFMCFIFTFVISAVLHSYQKQNYKELFFAGVFTGCGLWASSAPEGLYVAFTALLILTIESIFRKQNTLCPLIYSLGLFYATTVAWLINPPYEGYFALNNARLSIIHVLLTALILLSFAILYFGNFKSKTKQISALGTSAILSFLFMLFVFGSNNLFADMFEEPVLKYFVPYINEMQKMFDMSTFLLPTIIIGLIILLLLPYKQPFALSLLLLYFSTAPLSIFVIRFYQYYLMVWLFLYSFGLFLLFERKDMSDKYKILTFIYVVWPVFYLASFDFQPYNHNIPNMQGVILADTFRGPEIVWEKNADTVGSPYHNNVKGIKDNHTLWFTSDEEELKSLLKKRKITYVTLYNVTEAPYYISPDDNTDKLYGKVLTGKNIYPWMEKTDERTYLINYNKF